MKKELERVIEMVEKGEVSTEEALDLFKAIATALNKSRKHEFSEDQASAFSEGSISSEKVKQDSGAHQFEEYYHRILKEVDFFVNAAEDLGKKLKTTQAWKDVSSTAQRGVNKSVSFSREFLEKLKTGCHSFISLFRKTASREILLQFECNSNKKIRIVMPRGKLLVAGSKENDLVRLTAELGGVSDEEAKERAEAFQWSIEESDDTISMHIPDYPDLFSTLEIDLSQRVDIEADVCHVDSCFQHFEGDLNIKGGHGSFSSHFCRGNFDLTLSSGNILMKNHQAEKIQIRNHAGNLTATDIVGDFISKTSNGNLKLTNLISKNAEIQVVSGNIDYKLKQGLPGDCKVSTVTGDIHLKLPSPFEYQLKLEAMNGSIETCCLSDPSKKSKFTKKVHLGCGKHLLEAKTIVGNIILEESIPLT